MSARRPLLPRKLFEGWFAITLDGRPSGYDWICWEPHADRTAWFERRSGFESEEAAIDAHLEARLRLSAAPARGRSAAGPGARAPGPADPAAVARGPWPTLTWCRFRSGPEAVEIATAGEGTVRAGVRVIPPAADLLPSRIVPLLAVAAPATPGEVLAFSLLDEAEARILPGWSLVCHGPATIESGPGGAGRFETVRYTIERDGRTESIYWIDANRRIRKMDLGGPVAWLSTRALTTGGA